MLGYVIYLDILLLRLFANFVFVFLLLWATAAVIGHPTNRHQLVCGALLGALHDGCYWLAYLGFVPFLSVVRLFPIVLAVSFGMVLTALYPISRRSYLQALGYFYTIGFVSAGIGTAAAHLFGTPDAPQYTVGSLMAVAALLVVAEMGWGVVQRSVIDYVHQIPMEIHRKGYSIRLRALVDTGNHLRDPLTQQPVVIVEYDALRSLLPDDVVQALDQGHDDVCQTFADLAAAAELPGDLGLRLIPFRTLGQRQGFLLGFRPGFVRIGGGEVRQETADVIVALHHGTLDERTRYRALVPPAVLQTALQVSTDMTLVQKGDRSHATSSH